MGLMLLDDVVEVDVALLHDLLAAEHEQLIDQLAGALGRGRDLAGGILASAAKVGVASAIRRGLE
jgi:predicted transcriptional regulator